MTAARAGEGRRIVLTGLVGVVAAVLAACSGHGPDPADPATHGGTSIGVGSTSPSLPAPSATSDAGTVLAANGIGPYKIGVDYSTLRADGLIGNPLDNPACPEIKQASSTGRYTGQLTLVFRSDRLVALYTNGTLLQTPSGGKVGMTSAALLQLYGARASLITGGAGNQAILIRVANSTLGVSFLLDSTAATASAIGAGEAQELENAIMSGQGC